MANGNICIIGPRGSGKTTYLAALAFFEKHRIQHQKRNQYTIIAQNPDAKELAEKAKNILIQGSQFERTAIGNKLPSVDYLQFYQFTVEVNRRWNLSPQKFEITARDYPGEVFDRLATSRLLSATDKSFIDDCFINKIGCVMMLSAWDQGADFFYMRMMKNLVELIEESPGNANYKLAIVMTKCERGELWTGRLDPEIDLFQLYLTETTKFLRQKFGKERLQFFAVSTFGTLSINNPRPNRKDLISSSEGLASVLREPTKTEWKPYNLVEPFYWLIKS